MALFLATFINKLDKKGRTSVPATFRTSLQTDSLVNASSFVAFRSYKHEAVECCSLQRMQQISSSVDQMDLFSDAQDDLTAAIFADAQQLMIDGDGRVTLPRDLIEFAGITEEVAFIGRGATFQIWNPSTFKVHQENARKRIQERQLSIKLTNSPEGGAA